MTQASALFHSLQLILPAALFATMGAVALGRPRWVVGVFGGKADTKESRSEVRAVYGGFGFGAAMLLFSAPALPPAMAQGAALAVAVSSGGMALARAAAACIERGQRLYPTWFFVFVEAGLAGSLARWALVPQ